MSYEATVFNVLIASPGDVEVERGVARDVIHEWNAIHSSSRKAIFHPVGWETHSHPSMEGRAQGVLNKQIVDGADLLVAIFWTRIGTPTGEAPGGSVEEVNRHVNAGKPAMVYFSTAPVRMESVDDAQHKSLMQFKKECRDKGLVHEYESATDFRQKFQRHLAMRMNTDDYFATRGVRSDSMNAAVVTLPERKVPQLSKEAQTLLLEAAQDGHGHILHAKFIGGVQIQTNGKQFVEQGNPRSRAAWEGALEELTTLGYFRALGYKGEVYQITREGYAMAELLRR